MKTVAVILPMYNEEENVIPTILEVRKVLSGLNVDFEIIAVNDGSKDNTLKLLQEQAKKVKELRVVSYTPNKGLGNAIQAGFATADSSYVLTVDSDLSYDAKYIADIYNTFQKYNVDIVVGSPYMKGGRALGVPPKRLLISKASNRFISYAIGANVHTVTGILRGYKKEVVDALVLESTGPQIMTEILEKAALLNFKIMEIPAILKGRVRGTSKFQNQVRKVAKQYIDLLVSDKPLILVKLTGLGLISVGIIYALYMVYLFSFNLLNVNEPVITNPIMLTLLLGFFLFFVAIILKQFTQIKKHLLIIQKQNKHLEQLLLKK